ncbi:MAG: hypothetical protein Q6373_005370 [Candidatus Sigynarchaeota archaeon]
MHEVKNIPKVPEGGKKHQAPLDLSVEVDQAIQLKEAREILVQETAGSKANLDKR